MSEKRASLEMLAPTVEEAIERGLADLGLTQDEVEIEVLDSGSRGLFGLGFRQARVRLTIKGSVSVSDAAPEALIPAPAPVEPQVADTDVEPEPAPVAVVAPAVGAPAEAEGPVEPEAAPEVDAILRNARETVEELLAKMKIPGRVTARMGDAEDARDRPPVMVDIWGDDLSILIGPKAETLNALQYIAGLIVSKEIGRSIPLVVDVEGFRARRTQQIRMLARRMAEQAVRTGRRQVLEPMPANERRIIHIELRNYPKVETESIGEEPRRKVTIIPK